MDNRALVALLSSLISELLLLLFVISPPSDDSLSFPFIPFLSTSHTATTLSLLSTRRKRSRSPESEEPTSSKLGRRVGGADSAIPRNPDSFKLYFKMTSSTFEWLSSLLEPLLECRDPVNSPLNLPVETRLGIGLFRLATGSDYLEISQRFEVSEAEAKFCVKQFCRVLCTNFRFWVGFPTPNELEPVTDSFETLTGLPNCCGVIHCTRFKILKNESMEEPIAAQFVVDSSSKILSIVAGFNGRKGNHLVLKSSTLYKDIQSNNLLNSPPIDINGVSIPQYLIGDSGYPFLPWLMVPFDQPVVNSLEDDFNSAHNLMLVSGFRTVDSLKKWGVLSKPIREEIKTMVGYIGACSILHNALLMREDYSSLSGKSDEHLRHTDSQFHGDFSFEDNSVEEKSFEIRTALATRAKKC
ncbi:protein ALP1-like [Cynara cardunculus var. scolymus]|uniref:protein ALP1-like n=1 Tax=Cynara cardunculus var. scolymus TaxID=59895 RepID=UPI000D62EAC3|nr:protein ALP1-like [Cynara cardunculus var. scolymus]